MRFILFIIYSVLLLHVTKLESIEFLSLFEDLRIDRTLEPEKEEERQSIVRNNILNFIEEIGPYANLEEAIIAFVQENIKNPNRYYIINSIDTILHGNSTDDVFFIFDLNGQMQFVIKAFHNITDSKTNFFSEISGNALIHKMGDSSLAAPHIFAISKHANNEILDGLVLESAAKGIRLDHTIYSIGAFAENDVRRKIAFKDALKTFTKVGESFAKLQHSDESRQETLSENWFAKLDADLKLLETPDITNKLKYKINVEKLKSFTSMVVQDAKTTTFAPSYQFGSAHLKNIFYDPISEKVTLIDTGKLHYSVDHEGLPLADPAFDLIRMQEYLTRISLPILTKEETDSLIKALYTGYQNIKPIPDERLFRFYLVQLVIRKIIKYSDYDTQLDPEVMESHYQIFHEYVNLLNQMMGNNLNNMNKSYTKVYFTGWQDRRAEGYAG